jgi:hypothetical protein
MTVQDYVSSLLEIEIIAHIAHTQAVNSSYAEHKALGELYEGMVDLYDSYAEAYQGKYDIIKGYKDIKIVEGADMIPYLKNKSSEFEAYRNTLTEGFLQQMVDNSQELINSTLYKLRFLS